ncbi:type I glyceraldehyde-3-phosphate dehydrogenase [Candidatus Woesearchaeota archaeon]|nr:type I glyceraldehyde-3-phosphate dehydrogenase [Candidatus Woesearchaeota archaeon]
MLRVAINGFGRIGRMVFKAGYKDRNIEFVAFNDLTDTKTLAYLLKYDTVYGRFNANIEAKSNSLVIDGKEYIVLSEKEPEKLPWKKLNVDVVVESTGFFRTRELASKHLKAGARKVILSAPFKGNEYVKTIVRGVNENTLDKNKDDIITNASCTTNCLAPMAKVLNDNYGIEKAFMTTIHGYTSSQNLVDSPNKDLRRGRAAAQNIVITGSGATTAVAETIPELKGKMDGVAFRVPIITGSVIDFVALVKKNTNREHLNWLFSEVSKYHLKGVLQYTEDPIVSSDVIGNTHSCIFDALSTMVNGNLVKVVGWYDNELGYSNRMIDVIKLFS